MNNLNEIRELLPDYIKGNLSEPEADKVRRALENSPELHSEEQNMRSLFEGIDGTKYYDDFSYMSRNVPGKVIDKLNRRKSRSRAKYFGYAVPAAAMILLAVIFNPFSSEKDFSKPDVNNTQVVATNSDTVMIIDDEVITEEFIEDYAEAAAGNFDEAVPPNLSGYFDEIDREIEQDAMDSMGQDIVDAAEFCDMEDELFEGTKIQTGDAYYLYAETESEEELEILLEVMNNVTL